MSGRHTRLAAAMAAAWEAEQVSAGTLTRLAERISDIGVRARLLVLAAFARAHASRLLARLAALGRGPLPVPSQEVDAGGDLPSALRREAEWARVAAARYRTIAELARSQSDLSSAWVCELNRAEVEDLARELLQLADRPLDEGQLAAES